ncbi:NADH:FMN oxidoreductase [Clostridioides difficile]|nr:NADH:FMN oxidoreductase [Clostridioides difficile]
MSATTDVLDGSAFRSAMARFPSGVTIVTTVDNSGVERGFTATSFCSVSMDPPLVLVCLAERAECHSAFEQVQRWMVHIIAPEHEPIARLFATRGAEKFGGTQFVRSRSQLPQLAGAPVALECRSHARYPAGDHTILVGEVVAVSASGTEPALYYEREFMSVPRSSSV